MATDESQPRGVHVHNWKRSGPADGVLRYANTHHIERRANGKSVRFVVACFGKYFGQSENVNWSLDLLREPERYPEYSERLGTVLLALGVTRAYAPKPGFNAELVSVEALTTELRPGGKVILACNPTLPADVVPLQRYEAGLLSNSNCGVAVATNFEQTLLIHLGRECLLDREWLVNRGLKALRRHESVANTVVHTLGRYPLEARNIHVWVFFATPPEMFPHPLSNSPYAEFNRLIVEHANKCGWDCGRVKRDTLHLDLPRLFKSQLICHGVPKANIDISRGYLDGKSFWLNGARGAPRNLSIAVCK